MGLAIPAMFFEVFGQRERRQQHQADILSRRQRLLLCASCQAPITWVAARTEVNGDHLHSFFNPHGIIFHIGCFSEAPGCAPASLASSEFTWFPGFSWRVAHCGRCNEHLGWSFQGELNHFHGLILDRLLERGED